MDVSQLNNNSDKTFVWTADYKSNSTDDFALHLMERDRDADVYEPTEKIRDAHEDDPVRESRENDDADDEPTSRISEPLHGNFAQQEQTIAVALLPVSSNVNGKETDANPLVVQAAPDDIDALGKNSKGLLNPQNQPVATDKLPIQRTNKLPDTASVSDTTTQSISASKTDTLPPTTNAPLPLPDQASAVAVAVTAAVTATVKSSKSPTTQTKTINTVPEAAQSMAAANGPQSTSEPKIKSAEIEKLTKPTTALEKMRQDEIAKLSEKEALSAQISEILNGSKGKISLVSSAGKSHIQGSASLVSGTNIAEIASASSPTSATAITMITQNAAQAETPIIVPNGGLASSLMIPANMVDPALSANAALTGGAITGVESTSSNSASQASMASRATTQAGSPAEQVSAQIATAAKDGVNRIRIQLNPVELGRIDIKLELGNDGRVIAVIAADNQESLDLLRQDSKQLERALQDAGFETGSDSLSFSLNQGQDENETPSDSSVANAPLQEDDIPELNVANLISNTGVAADGTLDIQI